MDIVALIARARDHYVEQFEVFAEGQRRNGAKGASEVKLRLGGNSMLYERLYCVDFIKNDGKSEILELQPQRILSFSPIKGSFGATAVLIAQLRWDDVVLNHDATTLPMADVADWFRRWFDPDDARYVPTAPLSGIIHSLLVQPCALSIDFGTAPPDALWDILSLLEGAGATSIRVSSSGAEAETKR